MKFIKYGLIILLIGVISFMLGILGLKHYHLNNTKNEENTKGEEDIESEIVMKDKIDEKGEEVVDDNYDDKKDLDNDVNYEDNLQDVAVFKHEPLFDEIIGKIIGNSYKENDDISLDDLEYVQITYWGFDDKEHIGELIVNKEVAREVVEIFEELFKARFPIEKIRLIDEYGSSDILSMEDNNSSAFCYREITGAVGKISKHGYGLAIDINPVQNPYIKNDIILPKEGNDYLDRTDLRKGMIIKDDDCYNAFVSRGWTWGGEWNTLKDYQHFELRN